MCDAMKILDRWKRGVGESESANLESSVHDGAKCTIFAWCLPAYLMIFWFARGVELIPPSGRSTTAFSGKVVIEK
jgi:hypothetical protein